MMQRLKYFVSGLVLIIFMFYMVPHEVVHAFYDHEDTEHAATHNENAELSTIHIHCDFLTFYIGEFLPGNPAHINEDATEIYIAQREVAVEPIKSILQLRESRGPPALL